MNQKTERVLVTGGTGFIGAHIVRALIEAGYEHIFCTYRSDSRLDLLNGIRDKIELVQMDVNDLVAVIDIMSSMDYVIHAAAVVSFNTSDKKLMLKTNVEGTGNIVNIALESSIRKMVYISSIAALGRTVSQELIDETAKWIPSKFNTNYAISKYQAEREVWRGYQEGLPVIILNPTQVVGPGFWQKGSPRIIHHIFNGLPYYPPGINGFVDVRDVAKMVVLALESPIYGERIICNAENTSFENVFQQVAKELDVKPPRKTLPIAFIGLARRYFLFKSWFTGQKPIVTRESLRTAYHSFSYDNTKSRELFGMDYRKLEDTIQHTCRLYLDAVEAGRDYANLELYS
jgi:dihydroflavonol-4-reductase